jgi:DNA-binding LytR/AlgR family response regulator
MKIHCLIVDDEPLAIDVLVSHISNIPGLEIAGTCSNAFEAMEKLKEKQVDLMFLDVRMPKLMGHEFYRTLRNPPKVIFTTAHKEFAVDAFDLEAVDYLLKPITMERLIKAVNRISTAPLPVSTEENHLLETEGFLYFRSERKMIKVNYNEILYIESMKDYVRVVREKDKPILVKQSISSVEDSLPAHLFMRIHRSYIVSLQKIKAFTNHDVEIGGKEIPIGRLYSHQLEKLAEKRS